MTKTFKKQQWRAGTLLYPLPAVLVSVGALPEELNIVTVAWTGTICSDPALCYISLRKSRYSHAIVLKNREFVINLTNEDLAFATDWCGVKSGKNVHKFEAMKLTPHPARMVQAPLIGESPLSIECRVQQIVELGSHDMFIAEVLCVQADERFINPETQGFDMQKAKLITYSHGNYYTLGEQIGKFGWTVQKKNPPAPQKRGKHK
ncbi:MAG: flavin reductase family protein [Bacteroidales bacterium]|jgi:flavin reductase (DIM6/NTAB) family NADH-FMN oxidoreductase RutF|nr:flavin reductase family protein [Bacteroidales bacterium]